MDIFLYLLIRLWFVWIDEKYFAIGSSEVHINGNITAEVNSNDIRLECSFTLGEGDALYSTALTAENETKDEFLEIAGYLRNTKPLFTSFGMDLFGNETTLIHFDENHNMFKLAFDNVTCRHERRYKCFLYVSSSSGVLPRKFESDAIWISVTVPPSKPEMNLPTKVNDLSGGKRNKRSATIMPKNDTHDKDVLTFIEGDNITFICEGDVGRPEGRFEWQKMYANDKKLIYSNTLTETIPESCSYDGNSTLTIQVTGDDNQAVIRCIVKSEVSQVPVYEDSEPLRIQFQVRKPVITLQPDKAVFLEGDSIKLNCQSDGNPVPSYAWLKGNGSNETIIAYTDSFVIENANITDSSLYTCYTNNSLDGNVYHEINSTYISIAEKSTSPSTSTLNPIGTDNKKDLYIAVMCGGVAFITVVLFVIVCICTKRLTSSSKLSTYRIKKTNIKEKNDENKETDNEVEQQQKYTSVYVETERSMIKDTYNKDNPQKEDTYADPEVGVYDKPGDRRHKVNNCEPFDHVDTANTISSESNELTESKDSTSMLNCFPKSHDTLKSSGYESVEMNGETPALLSKGNGYEYADADIVKQHNDNYLQNHMKEDENVKKLQGSHQHVEYAQVDETKKWKNKNKHNDKDKDTVEIHEETTFESKEMHAKTEENIDHSDESKIRNKENCDEETDNPTFENSVSSKDDTIKEATDSPRTETAGPPIEHKQNEPTNAESKDRINLSQTLDGGDDGDDDDYDDDCNATRNRIKENCGDETESSVTRDHMKGRVNPTFENESVSSKDDTIKEATDFPRTETAGPPIEHKQNEPTNAESKDRINLSQRVDGGDDDCNATRNRTLLTSSEDTKQEENKNAETRQEIHERSGRTVDNATYFDTTTHLESVASSEDTKQKENKNAEVRLGINERSGRTVDNTEYFDTTTHFQKQHNHNDPETAIKNDQTKLYTNQAFDGEDNQEKDAVSSPVQLLDRLQVDEQNNQNNDKQSKHDYENVGSTAQPESSSGETI